MKTFSELREKKSPKGEVVFNKKMGKYPVKIFKDEKGYMAFIDGDLLDTYRSESDAKKGIQTALKAIG
jgi:hypothetical protein